MTYGDRNISPNPDCTHDTECHGQAETVTCDAEQHSPLGKCPDAAPSLHAIYGGLNAAM